MKPAIWVDADACPVVIREILYRAAQRAEIVVTFVANHYFTIPKSPYLQFKTVPKGFDVADDTIAELAEEGDLVITSDLPLANDVIEKGALVINSRGEPLTKENIRSKLNMRDFLETMRSSGEQTGGPPPLSQQDRQKFANRLDQWLANKKDQ